MAIISHNYAFQWITCAPLLTVESHGDQELLKTTAQDLFWFRIIAISNLHRCSELPIIYHIINIVTCLCFVSMKNHCQDPLRLSGQNLSQCISWTQRPCKPCVQDPQSSEDTAHRSWKTRMCSCTHSLVRVVRGSGHWPGLMSRMPCGVSGNLM